MDFLEDLKIHRHLVRLLEISSSPNSVALAQAALDACAGVSIERSLAKCAAGALPTSVKSNFWLQKVIELTAIAFAASPSSCHCDDFSFALHAVRRGVLHALRYWTAKGEVHQRYLGDECRTDWFDGILMPSACFLSKKNRTLFRRGRREERIRNEELTRMDWLCQYVDSLEMILNAWRYISEPQATGAPCNENSNSEECSSSCDTFSPPRSFLLSPRWRCLRTPEYRAALSSVHVAERELLYQLQAENIRRASSLQWYGLVILYSYLSLCSHCLECSAELWCSVIPVDASSSKACKRECIERRRGLPRVDIQFVGCRLNMGNRVMRYFEHLQAIWSSSARSSEGENRHEKIDLRRTKEHRRSSGDGDDADVKLRRGVTQLRLNYYQIHCSGSVVFISPSCLPSSSLTSSPTLLPSYLDENEEAAYPNEREEMSNPNVFERMGRTCGESNGPTGANRFSEEPLWTSPSSSFSIAAAFLHHPSLAYGLHPHSSSPFSSNSKKISSVTPSCTPTGRCLESSTVPPTISREGAGGRNECANLFSCVPLQMTQVYRRITYRVILLCSTALPLGPMMGLLQRVRKEEVGEGFFHRSIRPTRLSLSLSSLSPEDEKNNNNDNPDTSTTRSITSASTRSNIKGKEGHRESEWQKGESQPEPTVEMNPRGLDAAIQKSDQETDHQDGGQPQGRRENRRNPERRAEENKEEGHLWNQSRSKESQWEEMSGGTLHVVSGGGVAGRVEEGQGDRQVSPLLDLPRRGESTAVRHSSGAQIEMRKKALCHDGFPYRKGVGKHFPFVGSCALPGASFRVPPMSSTLPSHDRLASCNFSLPPSPFSSPPPVLPGRLSDLFVNIIADDPALFLAWKEAILEEGREEEDSGDRLKSVGRSPTLLIIYRNSHRTPQRREREEKRDNNGNQVLSLSSSSSSSFSSSSSCSFSSLSPSFSPSAAGRVLPVTIVRKDTQNTRLLKVEKDEGRGLTVVTPSPSHPEITSSSLVRSPITLEHSCTRREDHEKIGQDKIIPSAIEHRQSLLPSSQKEEKRRRSRKNNGGSSSRRRRFVVHGQERTKDMEKIILEDFTVGMVWPLYGSLRTKMEEKEEASEEKNNGFQGLVSDDNDNNVLFWRDVVGTAIEAVTRKKEKGSTRNCKLRRNGRSCSVNQKSTSQSQMLSSQSKYFFAFFHSASSTEVYLRRWGKEIASGSELYFALAVPSSCKGNADRRKEEKSSTSTRDYDEKSSISGFDLPNTADSETEELLSDSDSPILIEKSQFIERRKILERVYRAWAGVDDAYDECAPPSQL